MPEGPWWTGDRVRAGSSGRSGSSDLWLDRALHSPGLAICLSAGPMCLFVLYTVQTQQCKVKFNQIGYADGHIFISVHISFLFFFEKS